MDWLTHNSCVESIDTSSLELKFQKATNDHHDHISVITTRVIPAQSQHRCFMTTRVIPAQHLAVQWLNQMTNSTSPLWLTGWRSRSLSDWPESCNITKFVCLKNQWQCQCYYIFNLSQVSLNKFQIQKYNYNQISVHSFIIRNWF